MILDDSQHKAIAAAYIARFTLADLESMLQSAKLATYDNMHGNISAQVASDKQLQQSVENAIDRMHAYDKIVMSRIIKDYTK